ncbi:glutamate--tRNA ligase [Candidatus Peregrinibacteria bacterium CG10_big_fil_rev_8_21_14_0_10_49_16]|nr:MAG: glutamate--tRNA ligase [Candidatus Peregrinibacteria bacterium CG22_combo_CG10-13_8_21_14_all_49_11]PIR51785.1 MAG: glutamate--tRNA ligase [Candidatus Peregrinibacteria bacterium CG10_big_fil_rev_8_21_14_0_10_49_16]
MRTRFAPSPTGFLHIGGLRTALYAYLVAKQSNGVFLLRIEDTDKEREVIGATENILRTLHWAGIPPDEGVVLDSEGRVTQRGDKGPYIQSERLAIYQKYAEDLLEKGCAYYAFDTEEDIEHMRDNEKRAGNPAPKYDASIRMRMKNALTLSEDEVQEKLKNAEPYVVRMKIPDGNVVSFTDDIRGKVEFRGLEIDDQVLLKSDGYPTYHLANVVDDELMNIDIVIRGEEWLSSTPKHLLLYEFLGWQAPRFAHVPLLLNADRTKLSKRQGDVAAEDYTAQGYLPEALLNFLALLGWNPGTPQELFTLGELVEEFSIDRIQKGGAVFDTEKLKWLQGQWMRKIPAEDFAKRIHPVVAEEIPAAALDKAFAKKASLIQDRIHFFSESADMVRFFYERPEVDNKLLVNEKQNVTEAALPEILNTLKRMLADIDDWTDEKLLETSKKTAKKHNLKLGQLLWPLRAVLTGRKFSPGATEVAEVLGKEEVLERLEAVTV